MLESWHILNVIGVALEILGFVIMLTRIQSKFIKWFDSHWTEIMKTMKKLIKEDFDSIDEDQLKKEILNEMPKSIELRGIYLVIVGLSIQIISIFVETS